MIVQIIYLVELEYAHIPHRFASGLNQAAIHVANFPPYNRREHFWNA